MLYLQLFISFFKIGLFGFGGGLAILSLIQMEVEEHGWMTQQEFVDIVAVSQVTPGPIGINCATYVGYTATPYANIFIPLDDSDLFPKDFIINLPAPDNYIGPEKVFGISAMISVVQSASAVKYIPLVSGSSAAL